MKHLFFLIFYFWIIGSLNAQINQFSISPGGDKTLKKDSKLTIPAVTSASYKWQKNPAWQKLPGSGDVGGFPANPNNMQDAVTSINGISYCINVDNDVWYYDSTYGAWGRLGNPTVDPNSIPLFGTIIPQYDNSRLATDNQGNLYVALENNSNGNYFVEVYRYDSTYIDENAIFPVNVWTKLGSHVGNTIDAEFFDLTISPDGIPYVLIVDVAQYIAKKFNGTDWELVGGNNLDGVFPSDIQTQSSSIFIEFDPSGKPYALAWDQAASAYRLASFNGTRWEQVGDTGCGIQTGYDVGNFVAGLYNEIFISTYKLDFFAAEGPIALIDIKRYSGANYSSLPNPLPTGYKGVYPFFVQDGSRFPYLTYSYLDESDTLGIATKRLFFDEPNDEIIWQDAFHANIDASDISPSIFFTKSFNFDRNGSPIIILSDFDSNLTPAIYRFKGEELNNNSNEFPVQDSGRYYAIVKKDNKTVWSLNNTNVTIEPCIPTSSDTTVTACGSYTWNGQTYTKSGTYTWIGTNAAGCDSTASLHLTITYKKADLSIGSVLQGGKIAYILQPGDIGYEANKIKGLIVGDPSVSKSWTRDGIEDFVNTSSDFAQGQSNTTNIVSLLGPGDYAAYYCDTLTYGGYTDWYLPSTYEVKLLFTNRVAAGLADQVHSTSTQSGLLFGLTTYRFRNLVAPNKFVIDSDLKTSSNIVRPVRNFSLDTCIITCVPTSSDTTISACSSFSWNGQTFTSSGIYKDTLTNAGGCDSIATLNLTINLPSSSRDSVVACASYSWNGQTYNASGTYTWSGTNAAGCDSTATLVLTVKPILVWYKDADSDGYGTGDTLMVCDQPTGYRLLKDITAATGDCDDTNTTIYPNSSTAATSILASSTSVTVGGSITLSVNGGSLGASDTWKWYTGSCGGTAIGSGTSIVVSPPVTTTYYLRAEGCTNTNCVSVTIAACGPTGVTSNVANNTICSGTSTTLSVQGVLTGTASWKWYKNACGSDDSRSSNEGSIGSGASLKVSPTSTTTYYVRSEGGICGKTICKSITITVNPKPAKPVSMTVPAKICKQATIQLTVGAVNSATSYTWTVPKGWSIVSGQGTRTVVVKTGTASADVKVAAVNSCGSSVTLNRRITLGNCKATSSAVLVTSAIRPMASEEVDTDAALNIQTYPNPSTNYFTVRNNNSFVIQLRMIQASGQVVEAFSQVQPGAAVEFGARYRPGIYLVEASGNGLKTTKKVIKL